MIEPFTIHAQGDRMTTTIRTILADERGQGLAEYALILGLIAVVCIAAVVVLQVQISAILTRVSNAL
jgi:Flp pilus assembly pilin Flp